MYCLQGPSYSVYIDAPAGGGASIAGGAFGELSVLPSPLFTVRLMTLATREKATVSSSDFSLVSATEDGHSLTLVLFRDAVTVSVTATRGDDGVSFRAGVKNENEKLSVLSVTYPMPRLSGKAFDLFEPSTGGKVIENAGERGFSYSEIYPSHILCMPYFAVYGKENGVYLAVEDAKGAPKRMTVEAGKGESYITADFFAVGATEPRNSFSLYGASVWRFFRGDWYDATVLYRNFVHAYAEWLPEIGGNGRSDTPDEFKEIPYWVSDYIPNSPSQGKNRPMTLSAGSDVYDKDYWIDAALALKKELGVPMAYHVYNWHEIPFNIEYPHFLPAKQVFIDGAKRLRAEGIKILPYINGLSWEIYDSEMPHDMTFENTGVAGSVLDEDGNLVIEHYPQTTVGGHTSHLTPMCPSFEGWHDIMDKLTREMEETLPIDGIYYDQISAAPAHACHNPKHSHRPGGGSYWAEGYTRMMQRIRKNKPKGAFYFSECNAEPYMKGFDGYLTWLWAQNGEVPAFSAIYGGGYIQLIGRFALGVKKEDYDFFKFMTAKCLLYGQQIGWYKADVIYKPQFLAFLKKTVSLRYAYKSLWNNADMLRPPHVTTDTSPVICKSAGFWFEKEDVVVPQVLAAAWRYRNGKGTVLFLVNLSEKESEYTLIFSPEEYGIFTAALPAEFTKNGDLCEIKGRLMPTEWKVWEI